MPLSLLDTSVRIFVSSEALFDSELSTSYISCSPYSLTPCLPDYVYNYDDCGCGCEIRIPRINTTRHTTTSPFRREFKSVIGSGDLCSPGQVCCVGGIPFRRHRIPAIQTQTICTGFNHPDLGRGHSLRTPEDLTL